MGTIVALPGRLKIIEVVDDAPKDGGEGCPDQGPGQSQVNSEWHFEHRRTDGCVRQAECLSHSGRRP